MFCVLFYSQKELDLAHTLSSKLNEAYQCLSNPLARAEYILKRNGVSISESDHLQDMTLLANVMEAREVIDACTPDDISEIHQLKDANEGPCPFIRCYRTLTLYLQKIPRKLLPKWTR